VADPVSWYLIEPGWKVVAADDTEIGVVEAVNADEEKDIFDGLEVAASAFRKAEYVPAEEVAEITDGVVRLRSRP
jgi:hypothetical protein